MSSDETYMKDNPLAQRRDTVDSSPKPSPDSGSPASGEFGDTGPGADFVVQEEFEHNERFLTCLCATDKHRVQLGTHSVKISQSRYDIPCFLCRSCSDRVQYRLPWNQVLYATFENNAPPKGPLKLLLLLDAVISFLVLALEGSVGIGDAVLIFACLAIGFTIGWYFFWRTSQVSFRSTNFDSVSLTESRLRRTQVDDLMSSTWTYLLSSNGDPDPRPAEDGSGSRSARQTPDSAQSFSRDIRILFCIPWVKEQLDLQGPMMTITSTREPFRLPFLSDKTVHLHRTADVKWIYANQSGRRIENIIPFWALAAVFLGVALEELGSGDEDIFFIIMAAFLVAGALFFLLATDSAITIGLERGITQSVGVSPSQMSDARDALLEQILGRNAANDVSVNHFKGYDLRERDADLYVYQDHLRQRSRCPWRRSKFCCLCRLFACVCGRFIDQLVELVFGHDELTAVLRDHTYVGSGDSGNLGHIRSAILCGSLFFVVAGLAGAAGASGVIVIVLICVAIVIALLYTLLWWCTRRSFISVGAIYGERLDTAYLPFDSTSSHSTVVFRTLTNDSDRLGDHITQLAEGSYRKFKEGVVGENLEEKRWLRHRDESGTPFYQHVQSGDVTWDLPEFAILGDPEE